MSEPLTIEALAELCKFLFKRVDDLNSRIEAVLILLHHRRVFSEDELSQLEAQVRADHAALMQQVVSKAADAAQPEAIRRLLESFEGTKQ